MLEVTKLCLRFPALRLRHSEGIAPYFPLTSYFIISYQKLLSILLLFFVNNGAPPLIFCKKNESFEEIFKNNTEISLGKNKEDYFVKYDSKIEYIILPLTLGKIINQEMSYANGCISEYLGCHIFESIGISVQNTILFNSVQAMMSQGTSSAHSIQGSASGHGELFQDGSSAPVQVSSASIEAIILAMKPEKAISTEFRLEQDIPI